MIPWRYFVELLWDCLISSKYFSSSILSKITKKIFKFLLKIKYDTTRQKVKKSSQNKRQKVSHLNTTRGREREWENEGEKKKKIQFRFLLMSLVFHSEN